MGGARPQKNAEKYPSDIISGSQPDKETSALYRPPQSFLFIQCKHGIIYMGSQQKYL